MLPSVSDGNITSLPPAPYITCPSKKKKKTATSKKTFISNNHWLIWNTFDFIKPNVNINSLSNTTKA